MTSFNEYQPRGGWLRHNRRKRRMEFIADMLVAAALLAIVIVAVAA